MDSYLIYSILCSIVAQIHFLNYIKYITELWSFSRRFLRFCHYGRYTTTSTFIHTLLLLHFDIVCTIEFQLYCSRRRRFGAGIKLKEVWCTEEDEPWMLESFLWNTWGKQWNQVENILFLYFHINNPINNTYSFNCKYI